MRLRESYRIPLLLLACAVTALVFPRACTETRLGVGALLPATAPLTADERRDEAVVDEDHCLVDQRHGRAIAAIRLLAPFELAELSFGNRIDHTGWDSQGIDDVAIDLADTASRNGTHGELFVPGDAELADDVHVQRNAQRTGNFPRDRHSAAREGQHNHVFPIAILGQFLGE